jgi:hypothetical protein
MKKILIGLFLLLGVSLQAQVTFGWEKPEEKDTVAVSLIACIAACKDDKPVWVNKFSDNSTTVTDDDTGVDNWCSCDDDEEVAILESCGIAKPTFFNEQQFSWGFGIQNGSTPLTQWQYIIESATYQIDPTQITNNSDFTYSEVDNGDGTYDLIFTSTGGLAANATAGNYEWPGVNFGTDIKSANQTLGCTQ